MVQPHTSLVGRSSRSRRCVMAPLLLSASGLIGTLGVAHAAADDLVVTTFPVAGTWELRIMDLATGVSEPYMTLPSPGANFYARALSRLPGNRLVVAHWRDQNTSQRYYVIDPLADTVAEFTLSSPLDTRYTEGMDWSPRHNAILVSYGNFGTFATTAIALIDETGTVLQTAASSPFQGDLDHVASSDRKDLFLDLNRSTTNRVVELATLFPTPTFATYATPPSTSNFSDAALHPDTDRLYFATDTGTQIIEIVGNAYVTAANVQGGVSIRGLAFATLPPRIQQQPSSIIVCPDGVATLSVYATGGSPSYQWQRFDGLNWIDLVDGPSGTGSTLSGTNMASLSINAFSYPDEAEYRCVLSDAAAPGGINSSPAMARVCVSDFNCDGVSDVLDLLDFLQDFSACDGQPAPCGTFGDADLNGDGFVDILDFLDFLQAFSAGC